MRRPVIALLSDFGTRDGYVGAMKGVLVTEAPEAELVDISHEIPPGDILAGAWVLATAWRFFPEGTIFLCVVDPGVGTTRRAVAVAAAERIGVGPDNGIFTLVAGDASAVRAVELTRRELWRSPTSAVFHGRDVFAPVAAALARGARLDAVGDPIASLQLLPLARPTRRPDGRVEGHVIHVDRFGNVITDLHAELLGGPPLEIEVAGTRVAMIVRTYAEAPAGAVVALINSADHLELAMRGSSAAAALGVARGATVTVRTA